MFESRIKFMYQGPNRRSEWSVGEFELEFEDSFLSVLASLDPAEVVRMLDGFLADAEDRSTSAALQQAKGLAERAGLLYATVLLRLQAAAGQQVEDFGLIETRDVNRCLAYVAFDHPDCFEEAFSLGDSLFARVISGAAEDTVSPDQDRQIVEAISAFVSQHRELGTPADSWAIARAAFSRDIPLLRADRPPYDPIEGPFRIRPQGLMRLGHGHRQETLDGTFCVTRSQRVHALVADRDRLIARVAALGWQVPKTLRCISVQRVRRALRSIDLPVAVRSARRRGSPLKIVPKTDVASVEAAAVDLLGRSADVLLQPWIKGRVIKVVVAGGVHVATLELHQTVDNWIPVEDCCSNLQVRLRHLADSLETGMMVATLIPDEDPKDAVVLDIELAPRLDELLGDQRHLLESCAGHFVNWLFPDPAASRIPIAAITGTNGKTTTCHMTRSILEATGAGVGMACSDGTMVCGEWISDFEDGHFIGHTIVLDNPGTEVAVLESTRGSAGSLGMGFRHCGVGACLNVTEDHLEDAIGLRTLDDIAALKRTILERSTDAIVLNADDARCLAMKDELSGRRLGLVSTTRSQPELINLAGEDSVIGVLETIDDQPWLVLYHDGRRQPVMAGRDIPLSCNNTAEYNLFNALHAAAIGFLMGASVADIALGLRDLEPDFETFRGRLSRYSELPFEVIMDYAHNPDGLEKLCRFIDAQSVKGRKLINLSIAAQNPDDFIRRSAAVTAGHFDHYVCKNFALLMGREPDERPRLLRQGLIDAGVDESAITCMVDELESIDETLRLASPGDLVVIIGGKAKREIWNRICTFRERHQ